MIKSCHKMPWGDVVWFQINIDCGTRENITKNISQPTLTSFDSAQKLIYSLMARDCYPRFLKSDIYQGLLRRKDSRWLFKTDSLWWRLAKSSQLWSAVALFHFSVDNGCMPYSTSVAEIAFINLCDSVDSYSSREFVACIILYLFDYVKLKKKSLKRLCT